MATMSVVVFAGVKAGVTSVGCAGSSPAGRPFASLLSVNWQAASKFLNSGRFSFLGGRDIHFTQMRGVDVTVWVWCSVLHIPVR